MSCGNITDIIRRARTVGIVIELDNAGNLRLRAPNEPPQAMIQHLREHKQELRKFLKSKARAERAEVRQAINIKSSTGIRAAAVGFGICDRSGKPPVKGNELVAEGLTMVVHEKCYRGRGGQGPNYRPQEGGGGDSLHQGTSFPVRELVAVRGKQ